MMMANAKRDFKYEFKGLSDLLLSESGNVLFKMQHKYEYKGANLSTCVLIRGSLICQV